MSTVVFLVQRIGPYHHARFKAWAASSRHAVTVIEFRPTDEVYAWAPVTEEGPYARRQAWSRAELLAWLERLAPQALVCTGYADLEISWAVSWALARHVPLVTCCDSTALDEVRSWGKESFKRQVVGAFDAALVAGTRAQAYLKSLGVEDRRMFRPWDVVDNAWFAKGADEARRVPSAFRLRSQLPADYFFCVARFVTKKNLSRLIQAYGRYVASNPRRAWGLVISGSGPEESALRAQVAATGLIKRVHFPGFLQYTDLPAYYGLAGAFILPSTSDQWGLVVNEAMAAGLPVLVSNRCGCAPDLVRDGANGFLFPPEDVAMITDRLTRLSDLSSGERAAFGAHSRAIIAGFTPGAFAEGIDAAVNAALARPIPRSRWTTRLVMGLLEKRRAQKI